MKTLKHKFIDEIPEELEDGIIYISMEYGTAIHKCICGCGNETVTPFSPTDWSLKFDGETVSLSPSIGNWSFECQSHYWITNSRVRLAESWSRDKIDQGRQEDSNRKRKQYSKKKKSFFSRFFFM